MSSPSGITAQNRWSPHPLCTVLDGHTTRAFNPVSVNVIAVPTAGRASYSDGSEALSRLDNGPNGCSPFIIHFFYSYSSLSSSKINARAQSCCWEWNQRWEIIRFRSRCDHETVRLMQSSAALFVLPCRWPRSGSYTSNQLQSAFHACPLFIDQGRKSKQPSADPGVCEQTH